MIGFILGFLACGFLWALREIERRQAFEDAAEEIEALRGRNRRQQELLTYVRDGVREIRMDLGDKAPLPAAAERFGQHTVRTTTRLRGVLGPSDGGPYF